MKDNMKDKAYNLHVPFPLWQQVRNQGDAQRKTYKEMLLIGAELAARLDRLLTITACASLEDLQAKLESGE